MIDLKKIKIYYRYRGFYGGFFQDNTRKNNPLMSDQEWTIIEQLVTDTYLVEKNLTNETFKENLIKSYKDYNLDSKAINFIKEIALKLNK